MKIRIALILLSLHLAGFCQEFSPIQLPAEGYQAAEVFWADYDIDGDLDIIYFGKQYSSIYRNDGNDVFVKTDIDLPGVEGSAELADFDNDGDPDILLCGWLRNAAINQGGLVLRNEGSGVFSSLVLGPGNSFSSASWGDTDNDGDEDIILFYKKIKLYENLGDGTFTFRKELYPTYYKEFAMTVCDYDLDGDQDIIYIGNDNNQGTYEAKILRNDGNHIFTGLNVDMPVSIDNYSKHTLDWCDYDNDGDPDLLNAGGAVGSYLYTKLYRNGGKGVLTELSSFPLPTIENGGFAWGDYDNDGDADIALSGRSMGQRVSRIFLNKGDDVFDELEIDLPGLGNSELAWGDYDQDNDLDLALFGYNGDSLVALVLKNNIEAANTVPDVPLNLTAVVNGDQLLFNWDKASDNETPSAGLSYSLQVEYVGRGSAVLSSLADTANGFKRTAEAGMLQQDSLRLYNLLEGEYSWRIQSIDHSFSGSEFTAAQSVYVPVTPPIELVIFNTGLTSTELSWMPGNAVKWSVEYGTTGFEQGSGTLVNDVGHPYVLDSLVPETYYDVYMQGIDAEGDKSVWSGPYSFQTASCSAPFDLQAGNIRNDGALLDWNSPHGNHWDIEYGLAGFEPGNGILISNVSKPFSVDGLLPGTAYSFYARDSCHQGYISEWIGPCTFTTTAGSAPTLVSASNIGASSAAINWSSGACSNWIIQYGLAGFPLGEGKSQRTGTRPFSLRHLDPNKNYDVYVRDSCDNGILSPWSNVCSFRTGYLFDRNQILPFEANTREDVIPGDYDNDGDLDLVLLGKGFLSDGSTMDLNTVYENNGTGSFSSTGINLPADSRSTLCWGDYNRDGFPDMLIPGSSDSRIYLNSGGNSFTDSNISFPYTSNSEVAWADLDQDGDLDCVIPGTVESGQFRTFIFMNEEGAYEESDIYLKGSYKLYIADCNNDNFPDILMEGQDLNAQYHTSLYINENGSSFTEIKEAELEGIRYFHVLKWEDNDQDGDLDIIQTGNVDPYGGDFIFNIYENQGKDGFQKRQLYVDTRLPVTWFDYNNDGMLDFMTMYSFYKNLGDYTFEYLSSYYKPEDGLLADFDNDGNIDGVQSDRYWDGQNMIYETNLHKNLLEPYAANTKPHSPENLHSSTSGKTVLLSWDASDDAETASQSLSYNVRVGTTPGGCEIVSPMSHLASGRRQFDILGNAYLNCQYPLNGLAQGTYYWSVQAVDNSFLGSNFCPEQSFEILPPYTEADPDPLPVNNSQSMAWGDIDCDGDLDIVACVEDNNSDWIVKIFSNDGNDSPKFIEQDSLPVSGYSSIALGDYDNDNDLDIFVSGGPYGSYVSRLYKNCLPDSSGFAYTGEDLLPETQVFSSEWGDFDRDGDLDLLAAGQHASGLYQVQVALNDGPGSESFSEAAAFGVQGIKKGSVHWGDYNGDGYPDILLAGTLYDFIEIPETRVYRNLDGEGFAFQEDIELKGVDNGTAKWGDFDNDGDLDIMLAGTWLEVYRNDGANIFTPLDLDNIRKISGGNSSWVDYDNDGYLDIVRRSTGSPYNIIACRNLGNGSFKEEDLSISGHNSERLIPGDYDNDGDLDILIEDQGRICVNNLNYGNTGPEQVAALVAERQEYGIRLEWGEANDDSTPAGGLTYNLRIGSNSGACDILSPMAAADGNLFLPRPGNCGQKRYWETDTLAEGIYYWSVQAVDHMYQGGSWSEQQSFNITIVRANFEANTVCYGDSTRFTDLSYTAMGEITGWLWEFEAGEVSTLRHPAHCFSDTGVHDVSLTVYTSEYENTFTGSIYVKAVPEANFTASTVCLLDSPSTMINTTTSNDQQIASWEWNFGDGDSYSGQYPLEHMYLAAGTFTASLKVSAVNGCADSTEQSVYVGAYPNASISLPGNASLCQGDSLALQVEYNKDFVYRWLIGTYNLAGADSSLIYVKEEGDYLAEVQNPVGNCISRSSDTVRLKVQEMPGKPVIEVMGFANMDCPGEKLITLRADQSTENYDYQWQRNGVPMDGQISPILEGYLEEGDYSIVADNQGCNRESDPVQIYFDPELPEKPGIMIQGNEIWYLACTNDTADFYEWYYNNEIIPGANEYIYVADQNMGTYYVRIAGSNGCFIASDPVSIPLTGLEEVHPFTTTRIYPNPTPGMFTLEMVNGIMGELDIDIFRGNGQQVINIKTHKETRHFSTQIDLSGQPPAMYQIRLLLNKHSASRTVIVE